MTIRFDELIRLIETARNLSEPDDPNGEYIRGQVNLITDFAGLPGDTDNYYDILFAVISHETTIPQFMFELGTRMAWAKNENSDHRLAIKNPEIAGE